MSTTRRIGCSGLNYDEYFLWMWAEMGREYWLRMAKLPICRKRDLKCRYCNFRDPLGNQYCCSKKGHCEYKGEKEQVVFI